MFFLLPQTSRFCILENSIALKAKQHPGAQGFWVYFYRFFQKQWTATHGGQESSLRLQEQDLLRQRRHGGVGGLACSTLPSSSSR